MPLKRCKTMHLLAFVQNSVASSHAQMMWTHPRHGVGYDFARPAFWRDLGRVLERGRFDAMFIADANAPYNNYANSARNTVRRGMQFPMHDPAPLVPVVAGATKHLGVALTYSTFSDHPYVGARRLATLDHLTEGRFGWNLINSHSRNEFTAVGLDGMRDHDERYARGGEFLEVCRKLWSSWEPDAIIYDREGGIFADPDKVHRVQHEGRFYRCNVEFPVTPSPQGHPVIFQAGQSPTGRAFAARHAEAMFAIAPDPAGARGYAEDIRRLASDEGRDPDKLRVIMGVQVVVAETTAQAREKEEALRALVPDDATLTMLSGALGADFSEIPPDGYADEIEAEGVRSMITALARTPDGRRTNVRELLEAYKISVGAPVLVGSGEEVADQIEVFLTEGDVDGLNVMSTYMPGCYSEFVELVVPELQRRGLLRREYGGATLRDNILE